MKNSNSENLLKVMFTYSGFSCKCVKDIQNTEPGEPPKTTIKMVSNVNHPLMFSYAAKDGLNLTGSAGAIRAGNVLGQLLAIPSNDIQRHIEFFEKYGFFMPLPEDEYVAIESEALFAFVDRIKATIRLLNSIAKRDYRGMIINATYLLFSPRIEVMIKGEKLSTHSHRFSQLLETYNIFPDFSQDPNVVLKGYITIPDTMRRTFDLQYDFYQAVRSGTDNTVLGSNTTWYKHLLAMYVGCQDENEETRSIIDFYYHFQTEVTAFKEVSFRSIKPYKAIEDSAFSDEIKNALLNVARIVVAGEINHNIVGIHPKYAGKALQASWDVGNLISAVYFSIFYMKPGIEIYKECENPNCKRDRYFLVEATRGNKRYCCDKCANAAASQRHRNRMIGK